MPSLCAFDEAPLAHVLSGNLPAALGLQNGQIALKLAASRFLRPALEARILSALPELPNDLTAENAHLFAAVAMESAEGLDRLCCVMTVLINHKAILGVTSGPMLTEIAAWCGSRALILGLRDASFPAFANFHVLNVASLDALEQYAADVKAHLVGVLPQAYRERLKLRLAPAELCEPRTFSAGEPDEACFLAYAALARGYLNAEG